MWLPMLFVSLLLIFSAHSIKVPVEQNDEYGPIKKADTEDVSPTYYVSDDANLDSYLLPPDPHRIEEIPPDVVTPATFLLPPAPGTQSDYFNPTEPGKQTDWLPIANAPLKEPVAIPIYYQNTPAYPLDKKLRRPKVHRQYVVPTPSLHLEPPLEDAPNDYFVPTSSEQLQDPEITPDDSPVDDSKSYTYQPKLERLPLHLIPPHQNVYNNYNKYPKKVYPKKYNGEFKPVLIPIAQYADESAAEIPRAKPAKLFQPLPSTEIDFLTPTDDKINYLYRKAENKRKLKGEELKVPPSDASGENIYVEPVSTEQDTSESFRHPGRNVYPAPLKQSPPQAPNDASNAPAPDERTEFRMHGMKGPHSYQFGYDTGKGKNRQFRYEERENDGQVKGHYGYMDRHGKLRVVNYSAHPDTGFQADAPVEKEP